MLTVLAGLAEFERELIRTSRKRPSFVLSSTSEMRHLRTCGNQLDMTSIEFAPGGYRFIPGVFQYSAGVAALPGFRIERIVFQTMIPPLGRVPTHRANHQCRGSAVDVILRL